MRILAILLLAVMSASAQVSAQLRSLDGQWVSLSDYRGKVVVVSFSARGIPLTRMELPQLQRLAEKYEGRDVAVLWVSINSTSAKAQSYASDEDLKTLTKNYPGLTVLRDPEGLYYKQFGTNALPTILVLDRQGRLSGQPQAGIDPQSNLSVELSPLINRLLAE